MIILVGCLLDRWMVSIMQSNEVPTYIMNIFVLYLNTNVKHNIVTRAKAGVFVLVRLSGPQQAVSLGPGGIAFSSALWNVQ